MLPVLDLMLIGVLLLVIAGTAVMMVIRAYILPVGQIQAAEVNRLRQTQTDLLRLCEAAELLVSAQAIAEDGAGALRRLCADAKQAGGVLNRAATPDDANLLRQLHRIGTDATELETMDGRLATLDDQVKGELLRGEATRLVGFWQARAGELCPLQEAVPEPPNLSAAAPLGDLLVFGQAVGRYGQEVWALHDKCVESKKVVIGEDLLRFQYDRYDAFNMTAEAVEQGKLRIRALVDDYLTKGDFRQIFVEGHCDPKGGEDYNYQLSFMRALHVANIIREHLKAKALDEGPGQDFELHVLGYSFQRPLARRTGESAADWHSRLRRIEIGFRRSR